MAGSSGLKSRTRGSLQTVGRRNMRRGRSRRNCALLRWHVQGLSLPDQARSASSWRGFPSAINLVTSRLDHSTPSPMQLTHMPAEKNREIWRGPTKTASELATAKPCPFRQ